MKKYLFPVLLTMIVCTACDSSFLDIESTSADLMDDYYKTEAQIYKALVGAYDPLQWSDCHGGYNQFMYISDLCISKGHPCVLRFQVLLICRCILPQADAWRRLP